MATNLDVNIELIEQLMRIGGFKSSEAVDAAVAESLAWRRQLKACEYLGTIDFRQLPCRWMAVGRNCRLRRNPCLKLMLFT